MRRHNHRSLAAGARHVIRLSWDRILASTIDPKKGTVNRTLIGNPSWRRSADELRVACGQNAFAVPDTILKVKVAESRPVAPAADLITLSKKISERISFNSHCADAE